MSLRRFSVVVQRRLGMVDASSGPNVRVKRPGVVAYKVQRAPIELAEAADNVAIENWIRSKDGDKAAAAAKAIMKAEALTVIGLKEINGVPCLDNCPWCYVSAWNLEQRWLSEGQTVLAEQSACPECGAVWALRREWL